MNLLSLARVTSTEAGATFITEQVSCFLPIVSRTSSPMSPAETVAESTLPCPPVPPPHHSTYRHSGGPPWAAWLGGGSQNRGGLLLVKKDDLHVDIVPVLVQKVLKEVGDTLQRDVSTDHYVPGWERPVRWGHSRDALAPAPSKTEEAHSCREAFKSSKEAR